MRSRAVPRMSGGGPEVVGRFTYDLGTGTWWWSEEMFHIHGLAPGAVVPTSDLILTHVHPDDQDRVRRLLDEAVSGGRPFSSYHRIVDAHRNTRKILLAGHTDTQSGAAVLQGHVVDLTETSRVDAKGEVDDAIAGVLDGRAVIEQAKGVLMLACGISEDEAFAMLVAHSQSTNVKTREVAHRLMTRLAEEPFGPTVPLKQQVVALLDMPPSARPAQSEAG
jgi:hypothetical protein